MQNRRAKVHFRQHEYKSRQVKTTVVQGGVLSPALFNYYLADFQTPPSNIKRIKYADDIAINTSVPVVAYLINDLNICCNYTTTRKKTDRVNGQIYSNTFLVRYTRAPPTATSETSRPSTTALKEAKRVRSDARHLSHFLTTLQQFHSKSAAMQ